MTKTYRPSQEALAVLFYEYRNKFWVTLVACIGYLITLITYLVYSVGWGKGIDVRDFMIVAGASFGLMLKFFYGEVKPKAPKK